MYPIFKKEIKKKQYPIKAKDPYKKNVPDNANPVSIFK